MVRDLPIGAGGILSYFTRHKTVANLLLVGFSSFWLVDFAKHAGTVFS